jgi:hypothetical protein
MGDIQVLTRDEEADLARSIEDGNKIIHETVTELHLYKEIKRVMVSRELEEDEFSEDDKTDEALTETLAALDGYWQK